MKLARRYAPLVLAVLLYLPVRWLVHLSSPYTQGQYNLQNDVVSNLLLYLQALALPWANGAASQIALIFVGGICVYAVVWKRSRGATMLAFGAIVTMLPHVPFYFVMPRYLYLPLMFVAVAFGWLATRPLRYYRWSALLVVSAITLLVGADSLVIATETADFSQAIEQNVAALDQIVERHPHFAEDTLVYLLDPPMYSLELGGFFLPHYGRGVPVSSTDVSERARLRDHRSAYAFYFDDRARLHEQRVDAIPGTTARPALPVDFASELKLEGYELANDTVRRGDAVVLLLYWQATRRLDKNYTMFAHLIDAEGRMIEGYDSEPQAGRVPTSSWTPNRLVVTSAVIPIPPDTPVGDSYQLEVGVYAAPTMQRLGVVNGSADAPDTVILAPIRIGEGLPAPNGDVVPHDPVDDTERTMAEMDLTNYPPTGDN